MAMVRQGRRQAKLQVSAGAGIEGLKKGVHYPSKSFL